MALFTWMFKNLCFCWKNCKLRYSNPPEMFWIWGTWKTNPSVGWTTENNSQGFCRHLFCCWRNSDQTPCMSDWNDRRTTFWNRQKDRRVLPAKQLSYPLHTRNFTLLWYFHFSRIGRYLQLYKSVSNHQICRCRPISLWIQSVYRSAYCNYQERFPVSEKNAVSDYLAGYQSQQSLHCLLRQKVSRRQKSQMCSRSLYQKTFKSHLSSFKYRTEFWSCVTDIVII